MSDIVIRAEEISKKFSKDLRHMMAYGVQDISRNIMGMEALTDRTRPGEFWAVDDVTFDLKKGESLGVIGPNGSGKTTLLKMLNGIFMPDKGMIEVNGKVGALIQVGAGFHPMLTGRENIYVNGAILGMTKKEIDRKFDSIVEFSGIGNFLNSPVKHYSSGMYVRLGFSIAIHCEPDILLIDEILAVGDREFTLKCHKKMREVREKGVSIILVSHNEYAIREQTTRCVYLDGGKPVFMGPSEEGISLYIKDTLERGKFPEKDSNKGMNSVSDKKMVIQGLKFFDAKGEEVSFIKSGDKLSMVISMKVKEPVKKPVFGVNFYGENKFLYCANSYYEKVDLEDISPGDTEVHITIPEFYLPFGNYLCSVVAAEETLSNMIDWHNMAYRFTVGRADDARGSVKLPTNWDIKGL